MHQDACEYLSWLRDVRRCAPSTIQSYTSTLRQWEKFWGTQECDPTLSDLEAFCTRTRHSGQPSSAGATARDVVALKSYWRWRLRVGLSGKDVAADLMTPKRPHRLPRAIDDDTWQSLWLSPHVEPHDRPWLGLGFFCGLRRAELVALRTHQLNVQSRKLESFVRKGGGDHTLPLGVILDVYEQKLPHLRADLLWPALVATDHERLCAGITDAQALAKRLDKLIGRVDVKRFTPHALRHTAVTNLLRARVPLHLVSRLANHSSMSTTMGYVKAGGDELDEWLHRAF